MPHAYNRQAFKSGISPTSPLLSLYCSLVLVELAVKDHVVPRPRGHYVTVWLTNLVNASLAQQLRTALAKLTCTDANGNPAPVSADRYPDLRYLRHELDYAGTSTDVLIRDALDIMDSVNAALRTAGVL